MCPLPHPGGGCGWLARSFELGEERCCYRRRPPSFPGLPEIPAASRSPPSFSLLTELLFRLCGSPRSCSVSFCPPLRLSSLGSFLFTGPHRVGSDFPSLSHFFTVHPFDSAVLSPAPPLPEVGGGRTIPDSLPSARRGEARGVAKSPAWHLSSSRGAVSRIVPASRGAAGHGRSVAGIAAFPEDLPAFLCFVFSP